MELLATRYLKMMLDVDVDVDVDDVEIWQYGGHRLDIRILLAVVGGTALKCRYFFDDHFDDNDDDDKITTRIHSRWQLPV